MPKAKKKQPARMRITWRNHQKKLYMRKILGNRSQVQGVMRGSGQDGEHQILTGCIGIYLTFNDRFHCPVKIARFS